MIEVWLKRGDTGRTLDVTLEARLEDGTIAAQPLPAGTLVRFRMARAGGLPSTALRVDGACEITNAEAGDVSYRWVAADLEESGSFRGEFVATLPDLTEITFPSGKPPLDFIRINIQPDIVTA
jgi:hypothetical protein